MKTKFFFLIISFCSIIKISAYDFVSAGIYYDFNDDGTSVSVTYSENGKYSGSIDIPETVTYLNNEYKVRSIGYNAFSECNELTSVTIPNSVYDIESCAFYNCSQLYSVSFGSSVKSFDLMAFKNCISLTSIDLPNSVTFFAASVFDGCNNLASISLGNSVAVIGPSAFAGTAFYENSSNWEDGVLYIGPYLIKAKSTITGSYNVKDGTIALACAAFYGCSSLNEIVLPNSINSIGSEVFSGCSSLKNISIPQGVTIIREQTFIGCTNLESVSIPNTLLSIGKSAFTGCYFLTSINIPHSVTSIGNSAFSSCIRLTSVELPNSITKISDDTFAGCGSLLSVYIPTSVTSIGKGAFRNCCSLNNVDLPYSLSTLGEEAFYSCESLSSIILHQNISNIGYYAFYNCTGLTSIKIFNDNPLNISLDSNVFSMVNTSSCVLYVPQESKEKYAEADQWSEFANIEEFLNCINIINGEEYTNTENYENIDVTYNRSFGNTLWQPLYVPFNMSYEEWSPYAEVAELYNVRGYDTDNDGEIDDIYIDFNRLNEDSEILPNIPYIIRAKETGNFSFECKNKTILACPDEEGHVECSSTKCTYTFYGVYSTKTNLNQEGLYFISQGGFHYTTDPDATLAPNKAYLMVKSKNGGYNGNNQTSNKAPKNINLLVDGDECSSISQISIDSELPEKIYDIMGREVNHPQKGIYIKNGKKIFIK